MGKRALALQSLNAVRFESSRPRKVDSKARKPKNVA